MSLKKRLPILMLLDSAIVLCAVFAGYFILNPYMNVYTHPMLWVSSLTLLISYHIFAFRYRLYQKAWEYASIGELTAIIKAVTFAAVITAVVQFIAIHNIYLRVLAITWMIHILLIGSSRFSWRVYRDRFMDSKVQKRGH